MSEYDPNGKDPHTGGAKLDGNKVRVHQILQRFGNALYAVAEVGEFGAKKYTLDGWLSVPNGIPRYTDALLRHYLKECKGEMYADDSGLLHAAHLAWNALARLEMILNENEKLTDRIAECRCEDTH